MAPSPSERLSMSQEDYLEAIYHIVAEKQAARAKDIATRLEVSNSSVTGALRSLAEKGLVNYAPYDVITLTPKGKTVAEDVVRRHEALCDFFVKVLLIDEAEAEKAACKMEHALTPAILERLIQFIDFVEVCPRGGATWITGFGYSCEYGERQENCERCVSLSLEEARKETRQAEGGAPVSLNTLKPGRKARIVKIKGRGKAIRRIVEMGVTRGTLIEMERVAPLGDPIEVKVKGYHLSLRKEEAEAIAVEPL